MKYSVIIPAYQCAHTVENAVKSVQKSGLEDFEIIIVDDGSSDETPEICRRLAEQVENIRYVRQENQGVSAARNQGIILAKGDYIWFVDSDDTVDEGILSPINEILRAERPDMLLFGMSFDYYYRGKCYRRDKLCYPERRRMNPHEWLPLLETLYSCNAISPVWNKLIRRSLLTDNAVEFRKEMFLYEDLEFSLRCLSYCDELLNWAEIVYRYRQAEDEGNAGRRLSRVDDLRRIVEPIEAALKALWRNHSFSSGQKLENAILLKLYATLLRDKPKNAGKREREALAEQLETWLSERGLQVQTETSEKERRYLEQVLGRKWLALRVSDTVVRAKHRLAIWIKSMPLYRKAGMAD